VLSPKPPKSTPPLVPDRCLMMVGPVSSSATVQAAAPAPAYGW
jgi:hypothetical protein